MAGPSEVLAPGIARGTPLLDLPFDQLMQAARVLALQDVVNLATMTAVRAQGELTY